MTGGTLGTLVEPAQRQLAGRGVLTGQVPRAVSCDPSYSSAGLLHRRSRLAPLVDLPADPITRLPRECPGIHDIERNVPERRDSSLRSTAMATAWREGATASASRTVARILDDIQARYSSPCSVLESFLDDGFPVGVTLGDSLRKRSSGSITRSTVTRPSEQSTGTAGAALSAKAASRDAITASGSFDNRRCQDASSSIWTRSRSCARLAISAATSSRACARAPSAV